LRSGGGAPVGSGSTSRARQSGYGARTVRDALGEPQSILVLGGGSDIARATLRILSKRRLKTAVLAGPHPERLDETMAELKTLGVVDTFAFAFDVTAVDQHDRVICDIFERHGDMDVVLVASGLLGEQDGDEQDPERVARVIGVNFLGPAAALAVVVQQLRRQGHGHIVVLSSVAGERVRRSNFIYGSAKAGLDGFTQGLATSMEGTGISVTIVRPGFVHSKMTAGRPPAPFATTPDVVASAIVGSLSTTPRVVWVPSVLRWVFMIFRHLPTALFRRLPG
jgi:decaprenylphospho-beta-D-erythro-pentofuranosid-2-ulose 2-reductase